MTMLAMQHERNRDIAKEQLVSVMMGLRHVRPDGIVISHSTGDIARYMAEKFDLKYFDAGDVRPRLKRLASEGLVEMIITDPPNNYGGYQWRWIGP